ncbi:hypothetical protein [Paracoccus rhizosphaerae]|uniref:Uncharacterized protein n=1 Tax=Paracoccus rhizosphaerae TaxID=1133347 RepID=A0ABV6CPA9_9RHOB|nr:hypothetical protein [Paracoccus rhizosphaerae]
MNSADPTQEGERNTLLPVKEQKSLITIMFQADYLKETIMVLLADVASNLSRHPTISIDGDVGGDPKAGLNRGGHSCQHWTQLLRPDYV